MPEDARADRSKTSAEMRLRDWLVEHGLGRVDFTRIIPGLARRLRAEGVPVDRLLLDHTTLDPLHRSVEFIWEQGSDTVTQESIDFELSDAFRESPIRAALMSERLGLRVHLEETDGGFPVLAGFRRQGYTDYAITAVPYESFFVPPVGEERADLPDSGGVVLAAVTRTPGGFSETALARLTSVARPLALLARLASQDDIARNVARCYIGSSAGQRVLSGSIRLGDVAATEAVIWMSDLRGSTQLAETLGSAAYTALANQVFAATAGAVEDAGGEVLGFLGDGALAIFAVEAFGRDGARARAVEALADARARMAALNHARTAGGEAVLDWGLGLHLGAVEYGNIGTRNRHGWTVMGPAVNEAARIESLTRSLGHPVLASAAFAAGLSPEWPALGPHDLRGVNAPMVLHHAP